MSEKRIGILMSWFEARGFGFVHETVDGEVRTHFVHISNIIGQPKHGAMVRFESGQGKAGKSAAVNVEIIEHAGLDALKGGLR